MVEITAPPSRKQVVNALNAGADCFMADFEDALSPTWANVLGGHYNLMKAIKKNLRFYDQERRKEYSVLEISSQIFVRPRSLPREETNMLVDGVPISAALFDVTVYAFNNLANLRDNLRQNCYFYLPKIEFMEEAAFWNEILSFLEEKLGVPQFSFKVSVIVESVVAVAQLDEIVFALKERIVGLNAGRWNYIGSILKRYREQPSCQLDSRHQIRSDATFLNLFNQHVV